MHVYASQQQWKVSRGRACWAAGRTGELAHPYLPGCPQRIGQRDDQVALTALSCALLTVGSVGRKRTVAWALERVEECVVATARRRCICEGDAACGDYFSGSPNAVVIDGADPASNRYGTLATSS